MEGIRYITDDEGNRVSVIIDFDKHADAIEDLLDILYVEANKGETPIPLEEFKKELLAERKALEDKTVEVQG